MKHGCPDCLVTQMYNELKEEIEHELATLAVAKEYIKYGKGDQYKWPWSIDKLIKDVGTVASIDSRIDGKGHSPDWPTMVSSLVTILRNERYSLKRAHDKEREAKLKGTRR